MITNIKEGFDFLGWNFRKYNDKLIIKPSNKSLSNVVKKIGETIRDNKTVKQEILIFKLNQILRGWCNYHQSVCAKETFKKLNHCTFEMLWKWAKRRHPNKRSQWIKNRYWEKKDTRDWIFSDATNTLIRPTDIPIVRHERLKLDMNPYTDEEYFQKKKEKRKTAKRKAYRETTAFKSNLTLMTELKVKNA
ncbi:group II intron maturase-specific domain-containing protein [Anaerocolumna sp.]|uniref:group II intron maturase-specific domain-containing protein n=1 Tax=Anaerocolumna sp. TaxID=2041569 RepID=UPI0028A73D22|nr:group II intron maturase-specific domain-containing protein [Anaerocolumna sp.]